MPDQETKKARKGIIIAICAAVIVIAGGFLYSVFSEGTTLPQSEDKFNKFDHFRFQPTYSFLDYKDNRDLGQLPAPFLIMNYYRLVDLSYEKIPIETYKDKYGKMISVLTVTNSKDSIVYFSVDDTEHIQLSPVDFEKWNSILEYDSFDINGDGLLDNVFKLDLKDARDYYQLKDKQREFSEVVIMMPVKVAPIIGV